MGENRCNESDLLSQLLLLSKGIQVVKKGNYLFREGDESKDFFIVKKGIIQLSKLSEEGREISVSLTSEGGIIGELSLFSNTNVHLFNGKAIQDSEVYTISNQRLEQRMEEDVSLSLRLVKFMSISLRKHQTKFRDLFMNGKKGALYSTLIRLSNSYGKEVEGGILLDVPLTNQDLANYSVTTREGVNRMLQDLQTKGIVAIEKGRKILIRDLNFLKKEINCENCPIEYCNLE